MVTTYFQNTEPIPALHKNVNTVSRVRINRANLFILNHSCNSPTKILWDHLTISVIELVMTIIKSEL